MLIFPAHRREPLDSRFDSSRKPRAGLPSLSHSSSSCCCSSSCSSSLSLPFLFIHSLTHSLTLIALCCAELSQCFESLLFSSHFHLFFPYAFSRRTYLRCCPSPPLRPPQPCPRPSAAAAAADAALRRPSPSRYAPAVPPRRTLRVTLFLPRAPSLSLTLFSPLLVFFLLCIALRRAAHTTALLRSVPVCLCMTYCTVLYTVQCSYSNVSKRAAQAHEHNFFLHKRFLLPPTVFILIH